MSNARLLISGLRYAYVTDSGEAVDALAKVDITLAAERFRFADRAERLRKVDAVQHHCRVAASGSGRGQARWRRYRRAAREASPT